MFSLAAKEEDFSELTIMYNCHLPECAWPSRIPNLEGPAAAGRDQPRLASPVVDVDERAPAASPRARVGLSPLPHDDVELGGNSIGFFWLKMPPVSTRKLAQSAI